MGQVKAEARWRHSPNSPETLSPEAPRSGNPRAHSCERAIDKVAEGSTAGRQLLLGEKKQHSRQRGRQRPQAWLTWTLWSASPSEPEVKESPRTFDALSVSHPNGARPPCHWAPELCHGDRGHPQSRHSQCQNMRAGEPSADQGTERARQQTQRAAGETGDKLHHADRVTGVLKPLASQMMRRGRAVGLSLLLTRSVAKRASLP